MSDCLISLRPQIEALGIRAGKIGELTTLQQRLMAELAARAHFLPLPQMMGAWVRLPRRG